MIRYENKERAVAAARQMNERKGHTKAVAGLSTEGYWIVFHDTPYSRPAVTEVAR